MDNDLKEYIVTLKNYNDLDSFYEDMETPGGNLYIPNRCVDCANRLKLSRNTAYMLTDQEAVELRKDSRVKFVETLPPKPIAHPATAWVNEIFSTTALPRHLSWSTYRVGSGNPAPNMLQNNSTRRGSVFTKYASNIDRRGKDIDILSWSGHILPTHPEFNNHVANSRVQQLDWFQYNTALDLSYGGGSSYTYSRSNPSYDYHSTSSMSIAAGLRHGWAPEANIYNITIPGLYYNMSVLDNIQYIKHWHLNKANNPTWQNRNPTVVVAEYVFFWAFDTGVSNSVILDDNTSLSFPNISFIETNYTHNYFGRSTTPPPSTITVGNLRNTHLLWWFAKGTSDPVNFNTNASYNWHLVVPAWLGNAINEELVDLASLPGLIFIGPSGNFGAYTPHRYEFSGEVFFSKYDAYIVGTDATNAQISNTLAAYYFNRGHHPGAALHREIAIGTDYPDRDTSGTDGRGPICVGATQFNDHLGYV